MLLEDTAQFMLFSLIFMRMSGFIFLNPVLGRRNIPSYYKAGFVFVLTLAVYSFSQGAQVVVAASSLEYGILLLKEFAVGYVLGYVMQLFEFIFSYAGSQIDYQMGLSMAMVFDPQTNAQVAISGQVFHIFYILLFFAVDGHLALMHIILTSADVVPFGEVALSTNATAAALSIFIQCVVLAVKFSFPIIAIEFLMEMGVGILMKMIPQINLFVVSIQVRVILGIFMLLFLFSPMTEFMNNMVTQMIQTLKSVLPALAG